MKQNLSLKLQNKLHLTLSLKHQLNIMVLPKQELIREIISELEENPFLEEVIHIQPQKESNFHNEDEEEFNPFNNLAYKPSLLDTLSLQVDLEFDDIFDKKIALEIIDSLDEKGYLREENIKDITEKLNTTIEKVEQVREKVINFEPTGIASKSLKEFLTVEYIDKFSKNETAIKIINEDLEKIRDKDYLIKKYNISKEKLEEILHNIKLLRPYPLYGYEDFEVRYIEPDIFIYETNDETKPFKIEINEKNIPSINLTTNYKKLINDKNLPQETRDFLYEKLQKAVGLIKGIQQRRENLYKLMETLVEEQKDFLKYGKEFLKPLTLKNVSEKTGLHESTISRIVSNKFAQTPLGVIPLKSFFSNKVSKKSGNISSDRVKYLIQKLIESEDAQKPLSDNDIVNILKKEGINVARRTVTKYREELNIPDSRKRKTGGFENAG